MAWGRSLLVFAALAAGPILVRAATPDPVALAALADATLSGCRAVAITMKTSLGMGGLSIPMHMTTVALPPAYSRTTIQSPMMQVETIVDGEATITVYPAQKRYTRSPVVPFDTGDTEPATGASEPGARMFGQILASLQPVVRDHAVVEPDPVMIVVDGVERACLVVTTAAEDPVVKEQGSYRVLESQQWIGVVDGLLYRARQVVEVEAPSGIQTLTVDVTVVALDLAPPLTVADFHFEPPTGFVESQPNKVMVSESLEGQPAPDFTLQTVAGDRVSLSDHRGGPVIVDFWATWCGPCRRELVELRDAIRRGDLAVPVLMISAEADDDVAAFVAKHELPMPALLDQDRAVHRAFGVEHLPTLLVIDADGVVLGHFVGYTPLEEIQAALSVR